MNLVSCTDCELLPWDSELFDCRIARVTASTLSTDSLQRIVAWCDCNKVDCLYFCADVNDYETAQLAADHAFVHVDTRVILERALHEDDRQLGPDPRIRLFQAADLDPLCAIAADVHHDSRFFFDPHFSPERSRRLYQIWLEKAAFADSGGQLLAAVQEARPVGYLACRVAADGVGSIDLVGVAPTAQEQGLGTALLNGALRFFAESGCRRARVVTQQRNLRSMALYTSRDFRVTLLRHWYHRWFRRPS